MTVERAWQGLVLTTALSILAATIFFFARETKKRKHPGPVLICIVISSCCCMISRAIMELILLSQSTSMISIVQVANDTTYGAGTLFWFTLYFMSASIFWYLMLAMDLISSLMNPFLPFQSNTLIHHAHAWPAAGIWCIFFRFVLYQRHFHRGTMRILLVLPSYLVLLYILIALRVAWSKSRLLQYEAHISTRKMAMLILPYLLVFAVTSFIFLIIYLCELSSRVTVISNYIDQLTGALATIVVFVFYYFDSKIVPSFKWTSLKTNEQYLCHSTLPSSPQTPQDPEYVASDEVDVALKMRKSIMECMQAGIHEAAENMSLRDIVPGQVAADSEFTKVESKGILVHGQLATASDRLRFQDVAPVVFQSIRELFGIDVAFYRDAFASSQTLQECGLKGKSGNIMYFTNNMQFMVKSVPREEFDVLRAILPQYYKYLLAHRATHLCRYFGCHSITLPVGTRCMYFVVMQNLFNEGRVHEIYDIKGNTDRRQAIPDAEVEMYMQQTIRKQYIESLMLDIDFSRIHRSMDLSEVNATAMKNQLKLDINFLAEQNIMDYSILVGVKHVLNTSDHTSVSGMCNHVPSKDMNDLYFVGIIDMLQKYNWRWAVQRCFLALICKDTQDVSAVPARKYSARLLHFIRFSMFNPNRRISQTSILSPFSLSLERPSGLEQPHLMLDPNTAMLDVGSSMMWLSANLQEPTVLISTGAAIFISTLYLMVASNKARVHPGPMLSCIIFSHALAIIFRSIMEIILENQMNLTMLDIAGYCSNDSVQDLTLVIILFWFMFFFMSATIFWYLMLALDLISSLSNPFLPFQANSLLVHLCAWPLTALWLILFRVFFCMASSSIYLRVYMDIPLYIVVMYISVALLVAWRKSRLLETQAHLTTRRMAKLILPYLLVFFFISIVSLIIFGAEIGQEKSTPETNLIDQLTQTLALLCVFGLFYMEKVSFWNYTLQDDLQRSTSITSIDIEETSYDVSNVLRKYMMKYMSMGIIESATNVQIQENITLEHYTRIETKTIVVHGRLDSSALMFCDCAPVVFHNIRTLFDINNKEYIESFSLNQILKEHGSEGKSGNIFYFTANKQFMVKSVPKEEYDALRAILPYYHDYLVKNPKSYLCRYFGCHSITLPVGTRKVYFIVMHNLFNEGTVHQRFDLKGNTDRRQAIRSDHLERYISQFHSRQHISKLLLDLDFLKLRQVIQLNEYDRMQIQSQLLQDINFLSSRGIMDYSLLIGVAYCDSQRNIHSTKGIMSTTKDKLYHIGLIDMLQLYTWRWTLQRWFLGICLCKNMSNLSAVTPRDYSKRLKHFVLTRLFDLPVHSRNPSLYDANTIPIRTSFELEEALISPYTAVFSQNATPRGILAGERLPAFFVACPNPMLS
ncbi:phosphatidylinositol 4-phosphate 5-kinase (PIPK-D11/GPCR-PIPK) [Thraustotheca clavata]|uniref:Phosphatidylinositol 4-phosphate 5-kinase (PIPK-D11/GPCR-PIPK) n=1 Tax=Thraustotheca clavata TaxID=74557 RepID=A0A1W0AAB7_9STRA|nr:phosphatidylinositol 4-phosphate 5-kinase (PIPK-D11/GPCR-PIPK) [Thraustotheca clavata]